MNLNRVRLWRRNIFTLAGIIFLAGCFGGQGNIPPTDESLKITFYKDIDTFEGLKNLILSERLYRIQLNEVVVEVLPKSKNSSELLRKLEQLLNVLNIELVNTAFKKGTYDEIEEILFYYYRDGLVTGGQMKGIVYTTKTPSSDAIVQNLDDYRKDSFKSKSLINGKRVYSEIKGSWYVFYEYFD